MRGAQLSHPARDREVPLYLAATGPRALHLAGETADGVILILGTPAIVERALRVVRAAAAEAGRDPAVVRAISYVFTCVSNDRNRARDASRRTLAYYGRLDHYQQVYTTAGFGPEAQKIHQAWAADQAAAAQDAVTDGMIDAFTASGNPADVADALHRFNQTGLDQIAVYPYPAEGQTARDSFIAAVDAVAPLIMSQPSSLGGTHTGPPEPRLDAHSVGEVR